MPWAELCKADRLKSAVVGIDDIEDVKKADIICFNGFCSVHQLFTPEDVDFYKEKYPDILVAVHPECDVKVCDKADFVGSTSQLIKYITEDLDPEQKSRGGNRVQYGEQT